MNSFKLSSVSRSKTFQSRSTCIPNRKLVIQSNNRSFIPLMPLESFIRKRPDSMMDGLSLSATHQRPHVIYTRAATSDSAYPATHDGKGLSPSVILAVAVASCAALSFGYHISVINGCLETLSLDIGAVTAAQQGSVVSSLLAGAAVGSLGGSGLADSLGRRKAFLLDSIPLIIGSLLCSYASSLSAMMVGRFIAGLGIGLSSALVPLYISEIAPTSQRGALGSINQLCICIGILVALLVNVVLPATAWRTMFVFAAVPAVLLAVGMLVSPESPSWLVLSGQRKEAEDSALALWGAQGLEQLGDDKTDGGPKSEPSWGEVLANKGTVIGALMFVLQQFSGINAIVYFSSSVFAKAGITSGALASAAVGVMNVLGTVVAAGLMDKAGRKQLLGISFTGMGVCMLAMGLCLALPFLNGIAGPIALIGTLGYIAAFAAGAGPVPGLLVPEITPAKIRGRAVALAMGAHWICNFVIGQVFLSAVEAVGVSAVYVFFAAVCFVTVAFVSKNVVETKGKSLEDIERALASMA